MAVRFFEVRPVDQCLDSQAIRFTAFMVLVSQWDTYSCERPQLQLVSPVHSEELPDDQPAFTV